MKRQGRELKKAQDERALSTRRKYKLSELVKRITARNRYRETEWGKPQGEESW